MKERALRFFRLAEQYSEAALLLLDTLFDNGNSNAGIGKTMEEAYIQMEKNSIKSDLYLFIPALFNCLQSTELFLKGILLLNETEFDNKHEVQKLLEKLKVIYGDNSSIYKEFYGVYSFQTNIIKQYKKDNEITNTHDLYISLRYPEHKGREYNYSSLFCNGARGCDLFRKLRNNIEKIKNTVLREFRETYWAE
ncbi:MAG: HEPN domain-containing protein [Tyzzerella sp.]|nr:HEPN domain-containing protein [Tyzzerella sp.]